MGYNSGTTRSGFAHAPVLPFLHQWPSEVPADAPGPLQYAMPNPITLGTNLQNPPFVDLREMSEPLHMPSPPASPPESTASQTVQARQQALIDCLRDEKCILVSDKDRLINDKDRLIREKDDLINDKRALLEEKERTVTDGDDPPAPKTLLLQKYHQAVEIRDEEIKQLMDAKYQLEKAQAATRLELSKQRKKNGDLARALDEYMENDDDGQDDDGEDDGGEEDGADDEHAEDELSFRNAKFKDLLQAETVSTASKVEKTSAWLETVAGPENPLTEARKQMEELFGGPAGDDGLQFPAADTEPPAKRAKSAAAVNSPILTQLRRDLLAPRNYTVRPAIRFPDSVNAECGELSELAPKVLQSLIDTFEMLQKRYRAGKCAKTPVAVYSRGCASMWANCRSREIVWTIEAPRQFVCNSCFRNRRVCVLWRGAGHWDLLPLSPQLRPQEATFRDAGYYMYELSGSISSVRALWQKSPRVWAKKPSTMLEL
jgi:hypothetical protein